MGDLHHREIVSQTVIAEVITKRALRTGFTGEDAPRQAKIHFCGSKQTVGRLYDRQTMTTE